MLIYWVIFIFVVLSRCVSWGLCLKMQCLKEIQALKKKRLSISLQQASALFKQTEGNLKGANGVGKYIRCWKMNLNKLINSRLLNASIDKVIKVKEYNLFLGFVVITIALFVFFIVAIVIMVVGIPILWLVNLFKK